MCVEETTWKKNNSIGMFYPSPQCQEATGVLVKWRVKTPPKDFMQLSYCSNKLLLSGYRFNSSDLSGCDFYVKYDNYLKIIFSNLKHWENPMKHFSSLDSRSQVQKNISVSSPRKFLNSLQHSNLHIISKGIFPNSLFQKKKKKIQMTYVYSSRVNT